MAVPPASAGRIAAAPRTGADRRPADVFLLVSATLVLTAVTVYALELTDLIRFTGRASALLAIPAFAIHHLRSSIVFFGLDLLLFAWTIRTLSIQLSQLNETKLVSLDPGERRERLATIYSLDTRVDMAITTFFGIGVIYTAIGMESALMNAVGGIQDAADAAAMGAWEILRKLVDGGLILALSTTIFGGAGGYLLRLLKHGLVGKRLTRLEVIQEQQHDDLMRATAEQVAEIKNLMQAADARRRDPTGSG